MCIQVLKEFPVNLLMVLVGLDKWVEMMDVMGKKVKNHFLRVVHISIFFNIFFLDPPRLHREHGRRCGEQLRPDVLRVGGGGQEDRAEGEAPGSCIHFHFSVQLL